MARMRLTRCAATTAVSPHKMLPKVGLANEVDLYVKRPSN